jgi:hypothetical protein
MPEICGNLRGDRHIGKDEGGLREALELCLHPVESSSVFPDYQNIKSKNRVEGKANGSLQW